MFFPIDPIYTAPAIAYILKSLGDELKNTILKSLLLTIQKHNQYKSNEYKLLEKVEVQIQELQSHLHDERISKLNGGLTLLRDYGRTKNENSKKIQLNGVLDTFHQLASLPTQGVTGDYPNAKICSLAYLSIAVIYHEFNYPNDLVLEYVYKSIITYRPIAMEIFGAQIVSQFLNSGKIRSNVLPIKGNPIHYNLAFSSASDYLAIGVVNDRYDESKGEILLFDLCYSDLKHISMYGKHDLGGPLVFITNSNILAVTSAYEVGIFNSEKLLGIWDAEKMSMIRTEIFKTMWDHSLTCSFDGSMLTYGDYYKLRCFCTNTGKLIWKQDYPKGWAIAYAHNDKFLASSGSWINIIDTVNGKSIYKLQYPLNIDKNFKNWSAVRISLAFSQDDTKLFILFSWDNHIGVKDVEDRGKIRLWNINGLNTPTSKISIEQGGRLGDCENAFTLSSDGFAIISGNSNGEIHIWNINSGELIQCIQAHDGSIHGIAISPDGFLLASGGLDKSVKLWSFDPIEHKIVIP